MKSEFDRYLQIDLDTQSWSVFSLPEEVLTRYEYLLPDHCATRGWDQDGSPRPETLVALGVECPCSA